MPGRASFCWMRCLCLCLAVQAGLIGGPPKPVGASDDYLRHCGRCHGADGSGRGPRGERLPGGRIGDPKRPASRDVATVESLILDGRGAMPGFRAKLGVESARKLASHVLNGLPKPR